MTCLIGILGRPAHFFKETGGGVYGGRRHKGGDTEGLGRGKGKETAVECKVDE